MWCATGTITIAVTVTVPKQGLRSYGHDYGQRYGQRYGERCSHKCPGQDYGHDYGHAYGHYRAKKKPVYNNSIYWAFFSSLLIS